MSVSLSDVATINPSTKLGNADLAAGVSFLPMAAVDTDGRYEFQTRPLADVSTGYTMFAEGDVLLAKITPCFENGKATFLKSVPTQVGFGSTEFHVVRPGPEIDGRYLYRLLTTDVFRREGARNMTGSAGQKRVPADFLKRYNIPLPPLPEQRRIAAILDHADALRAKRRAAIAKLDSLAQSIFLDMFGDPIRGRASAELVPVSSFVRGFETGKSLVSEDEDDATSRYRVLKISAVTSETFNPTETKAIPVDYEPPLSHLAQPGDLLFSRANTSELIGATAYVFETPNNLLLPDKLWRFVWHQPSNADPLFVWHLFRHPSFRYEVARRATGTSGSMKNISQEKLLNIEVFLPALERQQRFSQLVRAAHTSLDHSKACLAKIDQLFNTIQHKAFKGEL